VVENVPASRTQRLADGVGSREVSLTPALNTLG
jgi:hypothetical protein